MREEVWSYLDALSEIQWWIFSLVAVVDGLLFAENYLPPWKIYLRFAQLRPFGSLQCWKMALGGLGSTGHGLMCALQ